MSRRLRARRQHGRCRQLQLHTGTGASSRVYQGECLMREAGCIRAHRITNMLLVDD